MEIICLTKIDTDGAGGRADGQTDENGRLIFSYSRGDDPLRKYVSGQSPNELDYKPGFIAIPHTQQANKYYLQFLLCHLVTSLAVHIIISYILQFDSIFVAFIRIFSVQ